MGSKDLLQVLLLASLLLFVLLVIIRICKRSNNALVIVEPRKHKYLRAAIENFDKHFDSSWDLYVFHGQHTGEFAAEATVNISRRRVILIPLKTDNLNADQYNELFKDPDFWRKVSAENILVFQTDAAYCGNTDYNIYDFTKFDYIGCSINDKTIGTDSHYWERKGVDNFYGVGGLSFRKRSFMMECIRNNPNVKANYPEDVFYSNCVANSPNRPMQVSDLRKFCTQSYYNGKYKSLGAHQTRLINNEPPENMGKFHAYCPEAKEIEQFVDFAK